eukprot:TRINITY_DN38092_c0_g1_i1.p1 TRINITY_DN38092_c0_g1~~TRINITY_DN38092_c0_g1_i1.p1  ORF type:complete len:443 (+),score=152.05 TRINITY_DN38092_c0_g1_i1:99-1427(+)
MKRLSVPALAGLVLSTTVAADLQQFFAAQEELVTRSDESEAMSSEERVAMEVAEDASEIRKSSGFDVAAKAAPGRSGNATAPHLRVTLDNEADAAEAVHFKVHVESGLTHPRASLDSVADKAEAFHVQLPKSPAGSAAPHPKAPTASAAKKDEALHVASTPVEKAATKAAVQQGNATNAASKMSRASQAPVPPVTESSQLRPKLQVVMSNHSSASGGSSSGAAAVGHLLAAPAPKEAVHFMAKAASSSPTTVSSDSCSCEFRGLCTCEAAIEFMDCISARCSSGNCDCTELQFQHACVSIAGTCATDPLQGVLGIEMACSPDRATCMIEEDSELYNRRSKDLIYEELRELKEKKCRLEMHADSGWLNAQRQLGTVKVEIDHRMNELIAGNASLPEMHCEKHFEEWHEEHLAKSEEGPQSASVRSVSSLAVPLLMLAAALLSA